MLDAALLSMNQHGRIACCGAVSGYDDAAPPKGSPMIPGLLISKRISMSGFIVLDYLAEREIAERRLAGWIAEGRLKPVVDVDEGLESAPNALIKLLAGRNRGKAAVRIG